MQLLYFAHANGFPAGSYRKLFRILSRDYGVEALGMVGHDSDYPVNDNWRNLVGELINDLECRVAEPVIGVGHSLGGILTLLAASERPDLFKAFVMLDPPIKMGSAAAMIAFAKRSRLIDRLTPAGKSMYRRRHWPDVETALDTLRHRPLFRDFDPDCLADYVHYGTEPAEEGVRLRFEPCTEAAIFRAIPHNLARLPRIVAIPGGLIYAAEGSAARPRDIHRLGRQHNLLLSAVRGSHMFPFEQPLTTAVEIKQVVNLLLGHHQAG